MIRHTLSSSTPQPNVEFFKEHFQEILGLCTGIALKWCHCPRALEAQDLVQEALSKIWRALPSYDKTKPLKPFVCEVACNAFKDACKTYGRTDGPSYDESILPTDVYRSPDAKENTPSLNSLYATLTLRQRHIVELRYGLHYQLGFEEIAEELGVTRQTVSSDHKKALKELERKVRQRKRSIKMV